MTTLPIHTIPSDRMQHLTKQATAEQRKAQRKARWERFKAKHIIMDDPRSDLEQQQDEKDKSPLWFVVFCANLFLVYVWLFFGLIF